MKKYFQYSLLSLLTVMAFVATGLAIWRWDAEKSRQRTIDEWNRSIDPFVAFYIKRRFPKTEEKILIKLLRQNPNHQLWKEYEFEPIFQSDTSYWLSARLSWPHQTFDFNEEQVHIFTASDICNRRLIFVHTDAAAHILEMKIVNGTSFFASHAFKIVAIAPKPIIEINSTDFNDSLAPPIIQQLVFSKSSLSSRRVDPNRIKIMDHRENLGSQ